MIIKVKRNMIVWKKACIDGQFDGRCLVKLRIYKGTHINLQKGSSLNYRKCRAAKAEVLGFFTIRSRKREKDTLRVVSYYDRNFVYKVGEIVRPRIVLFDCEDVPCTSGIHFFVSVKDAVSYEL